MAPVHHTADDGEGGGRQAPRRPYAFPGGRRLHVTDPSGVELGVWSTT